MEKDDGWKNETDREKKGNRRKSCEEGKILNSVLSRRPQDKTPAYVLSSDRLLSYHLFKKGLISVKV